MKNNLIFTLLLTLCTLNRAADEKEVADFIAEIKNQKDPIQNKVIAILSSSTIERCPKFPHWKEMFDSEPVFYGAVSTDEHLVTCSSGGFLSKTTDNIFGIYCTYWENGESHKLPEYFYALMHHYWEQQQKSK